MANKNRFSTKPNNSMLPWLGISTIVILLDQLVKITISRLFHEGESYRVTSFFDITFVYNKGAAFSFLAAESGWQRYVLTGLGLVAALAPASVCFAGLWR